MDAFLDILLQRIRQDNKQPPPRWTLKPIPPQKSKWIEEQARQPSDFDTLRLRQQIIDTRIPIYATCKHGELIAYLSQDQRDLPWDLWGRIFRLFATGKRITVYFLPHPSLRIAPRSSPTHKPIEPIQPQHINGGYTYPCRTDTIVIYRAEDATRVLLHELQHGACLDPDADVDTIEAHAEAWAELLYTAMLSKGDPATFRTLWAKQRAWSATQNERVREHVKPGEAFRAFPWRYTLGKTEVLDRWFSPVSVASTPTDSLRLTPPPTTSLKRAHGVSVSTTML